ncbi:hypothetical protein DB345_05075 [Spartobacteria bacterium LR76]|nr:hypothetical protein DB345_05075 [Spartobacteria bacterium LR76]
MKLSLSHFEWPSRHNIHIALPLMIVVAFLLHAACIVVFQITDVKAPRRADRSAHVFFLRMDSTEAGGIRALLDAADPSLFSPEQRGEREAWRSPETSYTASYEANPPSLDSLPAAQLKTPPLAIDPLSREAGPPKFPPQAGLPTVVKFSGDLADRTFTPPEKFEFVAPTKIVLRPIEVLVGVDADGRVVHIAPLEETSGNEILDRCAIEYLARGRFAPGQAGWGVARFLWGNDIRRATDS